MIVNQCSFECLVNCAILRDAREALDNFSVNGPVRSRGNDVYFPSCRRETAQTGTAGRGSFNVGAVGCRYRQPLGIVLGAFDRDRHGPARLPVTGRLCVGSRTQPTDLPVQLTKFERFLHRHLFGLTAFWRDCRDRADRLWTAGPWCPTRGFSRQNSGTR
jgi:hypothetical protein